MHDWMDHPQQKLTTPSFSLFAATTPPAPKKIAPPAKEDHSPQEGSRRLRTITSLPNLAMLQLLASQESGSMLLVDPEDPSVSWRVYLKEGRILFAESTMGRRERLSYLLKLHFSDRAFTWPQENSSTDYSILFQLCQSQQLSPHEFSELLAIATQEAMIQILALPKCRITFEPVGYLPPILKADSFSTTVNPIEPWIAQWRGIRPEISSPFQRLSIQSWDQFFQLISYATAKCNQLHHLSLALGNHLCLYQLARHLRMDAQELAVALHPLLKAGAIGVQPFKPPKVVERPLIACIHPNDMVQQLAKRSLERTGYGVLPLLSSNQALQTLSSTSPALALVDVDMPDLSGYNLCRKIRRLPTAENLPILLLLDKEQMFGEVRGRFSGASGFIHKPLLPQDLIEQVRQYVPLVTPND
jgi:twitching motility two-component system response regulator PilG